MSSRSIKIRLLSGGGWALTGKISTIIIGLFANFLLARLLQPDEFGNYILIVSIVGIATLISQMGLNQAVVRLVAESVAVNNIGFAVKIVKLVLVFCSLGAFIVATILVTGGGAFLANNIFKSQIIEHLIGYVAVWVIIMAILGGVAESFRGFHDIKCATLFSGLISSALGLLLFFILWITVGKCQLSKVLMLTLAAGGTSLLIGVIVLAKKLKRLERSKSTFPIRKLFNVSIPLWFSDGAIIIFSQTPLWVAGAYLPEDQVAILGVAIRLAILVSTPIMIANAVMSPLIAELYTQNKKSELQAMLQGCAFYLGIVALFLFILLFFYGGDILSVLFGEFYKKGGTILSILIIGPLFNVTLGSCGVVLKMTENQNSLMFIAITTTVFNIILTILLIKDGGIYGVAISYCLSQLIQKIILFITVRKRCHIWTNARFNLNHIIHVKKYL